MEHNWVRTNVHSRLQYLAIPAGHDSDGSAIYVARAYHDGNVLPAKYVPDRQEAYVCHDSVEIKKTDIEVLTGPYYSWVPSSEGNVPPTAIKCGQTSDGEILYIGRGHWQGTLTPGKIHPSHSCLYIPYDGSEIKLESYEVLVQPETWLSSAGDAIPDGAIVAGNDIDGDQIYVGRAMYEGEMLPAKVIPSKGCGYVAYGSKEHKVYNYELLVGAGYDWVPASNGEAPYNAVAAGRADGETMFIGRAHHSGSLIPGKIHPSHGCLYIPFDGEEVKLYNYEALVRI